MTNAIPAQTAPYAAEVETDRKYFRCACGRGPKQSFCDGSHKGACLAPVPIEAQETGTAWFCGCESTASKPLCDATRATL